MLGKKIFLAGLAVCFVWPIVWGMPTKAQGKFIEERLAEVEARIVKLEEESTVKIVDFKRALDILEKRLKELEDKVAIFELKIPTRLLLHFDERRGSVVHGSTLYGNHGVIQGAEWTDGISGSALCFDGKDDWVKIGWTASLDTKNRITLEAWINPKKDEISHPILEYSDGIHFGVHVWQHQHWSNLYVNFVNTRGGSHALEASGVITTGWQHIAAVYDGTYGKLYRNGELVASKNIGQFTLRTSYDFYIGCRPTSGSYYFNGPIDEVAIYSKALSPEEIKEHYEAKKAKFIE